MKYVDQNKDEFIFVPKRFKPLSYQQLLLAEQKKDRTYKLEASIEDIEINQTAQPQEKLPHGNLEATVRFHQPLSLYALVEGGWLPPPFVSPTNLFFDRNVFPRLKSIINKSKDTEDYDWWLRFISDKDLTVNPLVYAYEGNQRKAPTLVEFKTSYEEAAKIASDAFPQAKIIHYSDQAYSEVYKFIDQLAERRARETEFLLKTSPWIEKSKRPSQQPQLEEDVLNAARKLILNLESFVVIATLSCVYEAKSGRLSSPARLLLKPHKNQAADKYNALADLFALELFVGAMALAKTGFEPFSFCTCDKPLALFACGLDLHQAEFGATGLNVKFNITEELFPTLSPDERARLIQRISRLGG